METGATPENLQFAAVAVPVLALVITVAIDSVQEEDSALYRGAVGGLSALTLAATLTVILLATASTIISVPSVNIITNLVYVSILVGVLVLVVMFKELFRGVHSNKIQSDTLKVMMSIVGFGGIILILMP